MSVQTVTHLNFAGEAREALEFYRSVFGGETAISTYADFGMPADAPGATCVVFGQLTAENGFRVMAYDVPGGEPAAAGTTTRRDGVTLTTERFFVSVQGDSADEVGAFWEKLSDGATVVEPYGPSAWAPAFGMLTDRYGVTWILGAS